MKQTKEFWDKKANTYPRFSNNAKDSLEILAFFKDNGADFKDKVILDIGCGSGRFSLELAKEAKSVYGLDISSKMLEHLKEDAKEYGFTNLTLLQSSWQDFNPQSLGVDFDYVFASMTPALNSKESFLKALEIPKTALCYVGWGRERSCEFLDAIFKPHNTTLQLPFGLPNVLQWLEEENLPTPKHHYLENGYTYEADTQKAIEDIKWHISMHGGTPREDMIIEYVQSQQKNGSISYYHHREVGIAYIPNTTH